MVVVAIAGGTGGLGKTIAEQLQLNGKHQALLLGRKLPITIPVDGAQFEVVEYGDVDAVAAVLEKYKVDTVISTIGIMSPGATQSQLNLIEAAHKSSTTRRFIPSEFASYINGLDTESAGPFSFVLESVDALRKSGLKYTRVSNGYLMDYFGLPHISSYMPAYTWALDITNRRAAIPGTGDDPLTLTYSVDIARFVARLLDDEDWLEHSIISGSDTTLNEVLAIAEKVTGAKFDVTYDSLEKLQQNKATLLTTGKEAGDGNWEESEEVMAMMGMMTVEGRNVVPKENRLNDKYPDIHPMGVGELLIKAWTGR